MSKPNDLLFAWPPLRDLLVDGHDLWSMVEGRNYAINRDGDEAIRLKETKEFLTPYIESLTRALQSEPVKSLPADIREPFADAVDLLVNAEDFDCWEQVGSDLFEGVGELADFIYPRMTKAFGEVGSRLLEELLGEKFSGIGAGYRMAAYIEKAFGYPAWELPVSFDDEEPSQPAGDLILDECAFSVRVGSQKACELGNTRRYHLLKALAKSPGSYVSFTELAERMGGDLRDVDALPATKCRLVKHLCNQGQRVIADSIRTQPDHYGLFWECGAIEM